MEQNNFDYSSITDKVDLYSILRDIIRNLWLIILGAAAIAMLINVYYSVTYKSTYTTRTTFVVTTRDTDSAVYRNLSAAQTMAENFSNILRSDILKSRVCEDLGMSSFNADVNTNVVAETNLLVLTVTADSPYNSYTITNSIIDNYDELTSYVSQNVVMRVLQKPSVPLNADSSNVADSRMKKGFVYGFILFLILFIILSLTKNTIHNAADISEKIAAKSLGTVYHEKRKKGDGTPSVNDVTASFDFVENYKKIAVAITNSAEKRKAKSIVFTSVRDGEGKTNVALNVALTMAKQGHKVALVDADLRNPQIADTLGINVENGIADVLERKVLLRNSVISNQSTGIIMLLGNRKCSNAGDLVAGDIFEHVIRELAKAVDYVIIDSPAMVHVDTENIAHATDLSVLVVGYDNVAATRINETIDTLRECSPKVAGVVLNNVRTLPGARRAVGRYSNYNRYGSYGNYGGYGKYGSYGKYGKYGKYGAYGTYGTYGKYGHYVHSDEDEKETEITVTAVELSDLDESEGLE